MISSGKEGREHGCVDIMSERGDLMTLNQLLPTLSELVPSGFIESVEYRDVEDDGSW